MASVSGPESDTEQLDDRPKSEGEPERTTSYRRSSGSAPGLSGTSHSRVVPSVKRRFVTADGSAHAFASRSLQSTSHNVPSLSPSSRSTVAALQSLSMPSQPISAWPGFAAASASSQSTSQVKPSASASSTSGVAALQSLSMPSHPISSWPGLTEGSRSSQSLTQE